MVLRPVCLSSCQITLGYPPDNYQGFGRIKLDEVGHACSRPGLSTHHAD